MQYLLTEQEIQEISNRAALAALRLAGLIKSQVSTNEAYKRYGRKRVTLWRQKGLVNPVKQGGIIYWNVAELEKASDKNILQ